MILSIISHFKLSQFNQFENCDSLRGGHYEKYFFSIIIITSCWVIIARYDPVLDQSEHVHFYNHLANNVILKLMLPICCKLFALKSVVFCCKFHYSGEFAQHCTAKFLVSTIICSFSSCQKISCFLYFSSLFRPNKLKETSTLGTSCC